MGRRRCSGRGRPHIQRAAAAAAAPAVVMKTQMKARKQTASHVTLFRWFNFPPRCLRVTCMMAASTSGVGCDGAMHAGGRRRCGETLSAASLPPAVFPI